MLKPSAISGDSFRLESVSWWETHSCWEHWTWCQLPTVHGDDLYKQFWQPRRSLFVNNNYIRATPTMCLSIYCWSLTLTSHCLSHLLLPLLLLLITLSVIICIFSPLFYTLPFAKLPPPPCLHIHILMDMLPSVSLSLCLQRNIVASSTHSCTFRGCYLWHLGTCPFASFSFPQAIQTNI